jgi:hypothetical protein
MARYYVNKNAQSNGDHEVHKQDCTYLPLLENRTHLGDFASCAPAVSEARKHYRQVNGCRFCAKPCHTS